MCDDAPRSPAFQQIATAAVIANGGALAAWSIYRGHFAFTLLSSFRHRHRAQHRPSNPLLGFPMSKVVWVVMGLIVAVMAVGFASQRQWFEPQTRTRIITPSVSVATAPPPAAVQGPAVRRPASDAASGRAARRGWEAFDLIVNVLNVVVGIAGIWMTVHGMRMQRLALAAEQARAR